MEKRCSICKTEKPRQAFNNHRNRSDGLQTICRDCNAIRSRRYYADNTGTHRQVTKARRKNKRRELRMKIDEIKRRCGCRKCSEGDVVCLEFHHVDPNQKDFNLAAAIAYEWAWERVIAEINKCVCLCANCHRKLHAGRFQVSNDMTCRESVMARSVANPKTTAGRATSAAGR